MLKQVLGYTNNISVHLALTLFSKQIEPVLLYGCALWGIPDNNRHIYIEVNNVETKVKNQVQKLLYDRLQRTVPTDEIRAYREKNKILVKLHHMTDKLELLYKTTSNNPTTVITDHETSSDTPYEIPHNKFCRYSVGAPKYASSTGIFSELNRYPIAIKARTLALSYWYRLETGQNATLLQNAYLESKQNQHPFYQNIIYHMNRNGMGNILISPSSYSKKHFVSMVKQNMIDQHKQEINTSISDNDKFKTIRLLQTKDSNKNLYCNKINSPLVRKCFIRLRLDKACSYSSTHVNTCDICSKEIDTKHIVIECNKLENIRKKAFEEISKLDRKFRNMNITKQLQYILKIDTENDKIIGIICSYVKSICMSLKII